MVNLGFDGWGAEAEAEPRGPVVGSSPPPVKGPRRTQGETMKVTTAGSTVELSNEEWADLIEIAGYGIAYWCDTAIVDDEACTYDLHDAKADKAHHLTKVDIERAYALILDGKIAVNPRIQGYFRPGAPGEMGDVDSDAGDVLIQVAAFGEIVYG